MAGELQQRVGDLTLGTDYGGFDFDLGSDGSFELLWPENQPADDANEANSMGNAAAAAAAAGVEEDDNGAAATGFKRKRHTRAQIEHLEAVYQECPHPDKKQRTDLSERLGLTLAQVKFWFQNRRASNKNQVERERSEVARDENYALRAENDSMREAIIRKICLTCGGPTVVKPQETAELLRLRMKNAMLKDQLRRASASFAMMYGEAAAHPMPVVHGGYGFPFNLNNSAVSPPPPPRGA